MGARRALQARRMKTHVSSTALSSGPMLLDRGDEAGDGVDLVGADQALVANAAAFGIDRHGAVGFFRDVIVSAIFGVFGDPRYTRRFNAVGFAAPTEHLAGDIFQEGRPFRCWCSVAAIEMKMPPPSPCSSILKATLPDIWITICDLPRMISDPTPPPFIPALMATPG